MKFENEMPALQWWMSWEKQKLHFGIVHFLTTLNWLIEKVAINLILADMAEIQHEDRNFYSYWLTQ